MSTVTYADELATLDKKIRSLDVAIRSTEESLARAMKAEPQDTVLIQRICADLKQLEGDQAELECRRFDLTERVWV